MWTGEAANKPCKELMADLPLPPSGSQGSGVSPGEAPAGYTLPALPLSCFIDRATTPAHHGTCFEPKLPLNPVSIWIHQCRRTQTFLCQTQLDFSPVCFPLVQVGIFQASGHFHGTPAGHFNYTVHAWRHIMRQA